jgi:hypothetical protein
MSCILYNLASYRELTTRPTFRELWRDLFASSYYESPEAFSEALFELNVRAYCDRYSETPDACAGAREAEEGAEFAEYVTADTATLEPLGVARLWETFQRIEYQCSDAHDARDIQTYWHLGWAKDWCARHLCARVEQQHETNRESVRRVLAHLDGMNGTANSSRIAGDINVLKRFVAEAST